MFVKEKAAGEAKELSNDAKAFLNAAEVMEKQGLCQGQLMDSQGRICTAQAIHFGYERTGQRIEDKWNIAMHLFQRIAGKEVCTWNNQPGRTTADSAAMLRHIASKV